MPASASRADMMPACAAFPAWKGFVIVPKFDMSPEAWDALIAIAIAVRSASSRRSFAHAAAAASAPKTPVGWSPFWWYIGTSRRTSSAQVS